MSIIDKIESVLEEGISIPKLGDGENLRQLPPFGVETWSDFSKKHRKALDKFAKASGHKLTGFVFGDNKGELVLILGDDSVITIQYNKKKDEFLGMRSQALFTFK